MKPISKFLLLLRCFLMLLTLLDFGVEGGCVSNTYFTLNGHICYCDHQGGWTEANCKIITPKYHCEVGQIVWHGCNQCICRNNSQFQCSSAYCNGLMIPNLGNVLNNYSPRCRPQISYYINCSICICPLSGSSLEAKCAADQSCFLDFLNVDIYRIATMKSCMPNVVYIFPCVECVCSDKGLLGKCTNQCRTKCIAGTFYRNGYKVCQCPNNNIPDENLCVISNHDNNSRALKFNILRSDTNRCVPRTFTKSKCLYCDCNINRTINENSCLELDCSETLNFEYYANKASCSPGEMVPICIECFCFNNGYTNETYCTRNCSNESKLRILEKVISHSTYDTNLMDVTKIKVIERNYECKPNSLYLNNSRYCLCPRDNKMNKIYCTSVIAKDQILHVNHQTNKLKIDFNASCEPNTFVDFDCNTCYCNKNGTIDSKWCTYDDCEAKRIIKETTKSPHILPSPDNSNGSCIPGSISKVKCNYCICPESGTFKDRACTKNSCFDDLTFTDEKFTCEPLSYYEVDCNICFCPRDGLKNVDKCTTDHCEKSFLRSNLCLSGELFSDKCNVCVCPPNGNKEDKVCTNNTCHIKPWNPLKISKNFLDYEVEDDTTRRLDLCFPGEEFSKGCDLCVCPDLGLKVYATCDRILCDNKNDSQLTSDIASLNIFDDAKRNLIVRRSRQGRYRRDIHDNCFIYNVSQSAERKECSPGSMYIIRCRQCICPYIGNINNFCRPLPKNFYCEEAFPGINYLPMGRRNPINDSTIRPIVEDKNRTITVKHTNHTIYKCHKPGKVEDDCFICECENKKLIEEHCFKSNSKKCIDAKPTFIRLDEI